MRIEFMKELLDESKMKETIRRRGNLSAPGLDELTNPIIEIEQDITAKLMISMMKLMFNSNICPREWKKARTVLLFKRGEVNELKNWRLITITSILYRIVFCRIAQTILWLYEINGKTICDEGQKGFVTKKAGCEQHTAMANSIIM
ncbi:MAG: hypothetical protein Ta2E_13340 [Mycoplasmoidaceae bacterium]|nr:MAG: hypothetical protein Ta2E_13340 [Mycoplasmoidaceae bacterium]